MRTLDHEDLVVPEDADADVPSQQPATPALLLSTTEAAAALSIGRSKLYELIAAGEIEVVHIGRSSRVPVDAVHAFVERLRER